jgi:hypothetical protein
MQGHYPSHFERDTAGTEAEWLSRLPGACAGHALTLGERRAGVMLDQGRLTLNWTVLPARQIALLRMERMSVRFDFDGVDEPERQRFMRYFDLYMQRGGG